MADGLTGNKGGGFFKKALEKFNNVKQTLNEPGTNYERTPLFKKDLEDFQKDLKDLRKEQFDDKMGKEKNKAFQNRMNQEEWNRMLKKGRGIEVPEIETEVVDLPPEDENEKEIIVDNNPTDATMGDGIEEVNPEDIQLEGEVEDNDGEYYENAVSGEEVGDPSIYPSDEEIADVEDTKKPKESADGEDKKEEPKEEEKKEPMSDEDALKEAQELAQDELTGFKISGANWEKMSEKQKAEAIKAFKDANKKEDHRTYNSKDESTTNNFETYERYPTGLKVASMAGNALQTAGEDVGNVARNVGKEGTNSGSIASEVARAVPHFDYRSLFR